MKILFNCSTNIVGGGLKNSALFIKNAVNDNTTDWYFAISKPVQLLLNQWGLDIPENRIIVFEISPARNNAARKKLVNFCRQVKADLVYTMAGPAYTSFPCKHIMGISNAYITHADWDAYKLKGGLRKILRYYAYTLIQFIYTYKADYYVFQTQYAKQSFRNRSHISNKKLFVISNAYDNSILDFFKKKENYVQKKDDIIRIFCPGANYIHKGLQFIPGIISELVKCSDKKFEFILTLPLDSILWKEIELELKNKNLLKYCINAGPFAYTELVYLLDNCDIVFVPSLLETFSASYLEAICASKKLIVANKAFARDICQNYAVYTNPQDFKESAEKINEVFDKLILTDLEIELGNKILSQYGNQELRYDKLSELIKSLSTN